MSIKLQRVPILVKISKIFEQTIFRSFFIPFTLIFLFSEREVTDDLYLNLTLNLFSLFFLGFGFVFKIWSNFYLSFKPIKLGGPFRHVQNPQQLAITLTYIASLIFFRIQLNCTLAFIVLCFMYFSFQSLAANYFRYTELGPYYMRYKMRVKPWIVSILPGSNPPVERFSLKKSICPERFLIIWMVTILIATSLRNHYPVFFEENSLQNYFRYLIK